MKISTLILFLFLSVELFAQTSISEARQKAVGSTVTVSGVVSNGAELGTIRYIQDNTGGIGLYDYSALDNILRGDSITVTGELDSYYNLLEIKSFSNLTVHKTGSPLYAPKEIIISDIGEDYESELIQIDNVVFINTDNLFAGDKNYLFTDGTNTGEIRINRDNPLVGQVIPTDTFDLIAICSQWSLDNPNSGYQLLPRDVNDFILHTNIQLTSGLEATEHTTNSITIEWNTDTEGTSEIRYGSSMEESALTGYASGESTVNSDEYTHRAQVTGLESAEIIYIQAFSASESDTAFSAIGAFVTNSNSSGDIKVYFNSEVDESYAGTTIASNLNDSMADTLAAYINRANETIDFCIYNIDNSTIADALNAAYDRGVTIRFITCGSTGHASVYNLNNNIPILERPDLDDGIMHNKFVIFDANATNANASWIWSGSTNLTQNQLTYDSNNMIFIQDQSLAKVYEVEFEEMWGSDSDQPDAGNAKFGEAKINNTPHHIQVGDKLITCYFSPSDNTNQQLINAINTADHTLDIETMLITRSDLGNAITNAFDRGVDVNVLMEEENEYTPSFIKNTLPQDKYILDNAAGQLHHKIALIDANNADSDPQVITGSHNWSNSANDRNDENTLIIHDADIANQYYQQFAYRFKENNGTLVVSAEIIKSTSIKVFPNPTEGRLTINAAREITNISVYNSTGAKIDELQPNENLAEFSLPYNLTGLFLLKVELSNGDYNTYKILKK
ncbi:phospholipase D-like domain-containing protein [Draconibacterium sp. IB214405]|uniref:phospholipase D-like domain-containing protein n=1 Tax=Draconibacterium sp. IB214405 TaxID=3097352 RepID=UPI002A0EF216|nr:phospholipase D-like domain-containing protein [Draconibacterium sp. IB214405]MDX8338528.1 phospholipase D-like domain-containing protein [Draconibacterium sp. IB214405]